MAIQLVSGRARNQIQNYLTLNLTLLSNDVGETPGTGSQKPIIKFLGLSRVGC